MLQSFNMPRKQEKPGKFNRPPRIRVPNQERAVFTVDNQKFVGVLQRLSLTGGSAILARTEVPNGTLGEITLNTVFGRVMAEIEFLQTGADGVPMAQAFRFLRMNDVSGQRFAAAAKQMQKAGFSDSEEAQGSLEMMYEGLSRLGQSLRSFSAKVGSRKK